MTRIFSALALFSIGLLLANLVVGLWGGDYNGRQELRTLLERLNQPPSAASPETATLDQMKEQAKLLRDQLQPLQRHATVHFLLGVLAALAAVMVNSISVTYFIGTSRWCKEVTEAYDLAPDLARQSAAVKRRSFPWAVVGILAAIIIAALGAAANPLTPRQDTARWVLPHAMAAVVGTLIIGYSFYMQHGRITANHQVINDVLDRVHRIRLQRGLDEHPTA